MDFLVRLSPLELGVPYWLNGQQDEARRSFDGAIEQSQSVPSYVETIETVRERRLGYEIGQGMQTDKSRDGVGLSKTKRKKRRLRRERICLQTSITP